MPAPINPQPRTPTVCIAMLVLFPGATGVQEKFNISRSPVTPVKVLDSFHDRRYSLSAADACGGEATFQSTPAQFERERQQQARAGHAERMAERDGAAVDVDAIAVE